MRGLRVLLPHFYSRMLDDSETYVKPTPADWLRTRLTLSAWSLKVGFGLAWLGLVIFTFYEAQNLPYATDDFFGTLGFLNHWQDAIGITAKLRTLFEGVNGSLIVTIHLAQLAWVGLTGQYSFTLFSCLNAFFFGLAAFELYRRVFPEAKAGILFLSGLLICKPIYQEILFMGQGSQNTLCFLFALWGLDAAHHAETPRGLWKTGLLATGAGLTSGNGPLVFLLVPVLLLLTREKPGRWLYTWSSWFIFFFLGYTRLYQPAHNPYLSEILQEQPQILLYNLIYLVGGGLELSRWMLILEAGIGVVLLLGFAYWFLTGKARQNPVAACLLLFLLGSAVLVVLGRSVPRFDLEYTLPSRYKLFPYLFISIGLYLVGPWLSARLGVWARFGLGAVLAAGFLAVFVQIYGYSARTTATLNAEHTAALKAFAEGQTPASLYCLGNTNEPCAKELLRAAELGYYDFRTQIR